MKIVNSILSLIERHKRQGYVVNYITLDRQGYIDLLFEVHPESRKSDTVLDHICRPQKMPTFLFKGVSINDAGVGGLVAPYVVGLK